MCCQHRSTRTAASVFKAILKSSSYSLTKNSVLGPTVEILKSSKKAFDSLSTAAMSQMAMSRCTVYACPSKFSEKAIRCAARSQASKYCALISIATLASKECRPAILNCGLTYRLLVSSAICLNCPSLQAAQMPFRISGGVGHSQKRQFVVHAAAAVQEVSM